MSFRICIIAFIVFISWGNTAGRAESTAQITAPSTIRSGDYLPVVVRFITSDGKIDSTVTGDHRLRASSGSLSKTTIKVFRGVGSVTTRATASSDFLSLTIDGFSGSRTVGLLTNPQTVNHQGTLSSSAFWDSGIIHVITADLKIPAGVTLTVNAGVLIKVAQDANIEVDGSIVSDGTLSNPVYWTSSTWGNNWGGIELHPGSTDSRFNYTFFTDGGGDQSRIFIHSNSQPVVKADGTILIMDNCYFIDNRGKGVGTNESENYLTGCLFARCDIGAEFRFSNTFLTEVYTMFMPDEDGVASDVDNDGIYFWNKKSSGGVRSVLNRCVLHLSEDDGIDINRNAKVDIRYSFVNRVLDKGISVSMGADLTAYRSIIANCVDYGLGIKEGDVVVFDQGTLYGNGTGIKFYGNARLTLTSTIISQSPGGSILNPSDGTLVCSYSLSDLHTLPGTGNLRSNPKFVNPGSLDFRLQEVSPAINAGNPNAGLDPDGTRADMGAYPFLQFVDPVAGIVINEIVSQYGNSYPDEHGNYSDWFELYNKNDFPVNLAGLYFTDHSSDPTLFRIPSGNPARTTIPANGFLVFFADNQPELGANHVGFQLVSSGEEIGIAQKTGTEIIILDQWSFPGLAVDESYGRFPDGTGTQRKLPVSTPGSTNINEIRELKNVLFINEFMARFPDSYPDEHGLFSDWIEIFNAGIQDINVEGLYLSDNKANPTQHRIPLGLGDSTLIRAGGFKVFRADASPQLGYNHLNFELAGAGEDVTLVQVSGGVTLYIDSVHYIPQSMGVSHGRPADGQPGWRQFWTPTPGQSNSRTSGIVETGTLNHPVSVYPNPFETSVTIRYQLTEPSDVTIRITDLTGKTVYSFYLAGEIQSTGEHAVEWTGTGPSGQQLPSGVYAVTILPGKGIPQRSLMIKN